MKIPTIAAVLGLAAAVSAEVFLHETFSDGEGWKERWTPSNHREDLGKLEVSPGKWFTDEASKAGLRTTEDYRFYATSTKLAKPFSNKDKDLVIQFDVKNEQDIDCGGSYLKVRLENYAFFVCLLLETKVIRIASSSLEIISMQRLSMVIVNTTSCLVLIFVVPRLWFMLFSIIMAPTTI